MATTTLQHDMGWTFATLNGAVRTAESIMSEYLSQGKYCNLYVSPQTNEVTLDVFLKDLDEYKEYDRVWYTERTRLHLHTLATSCASEIDTYIDRFIFNVEEKLY